MRAKEVQLLLGISSSVLKRYRKNGMLKAKQIQSKWFEYDDKSVAELSDLLASSSRGEVIQYVLTFGPVRKLIRKYPKAVKFIGIKGALNLVNELGNYPDIEVIVYGEGNDEVEEELYRILVTKNIPFTRVKD